MCHARNSHLIGAQTFAWHMTFCKACPLRGTTKSLWRCFCFPRTYHLRIARTFGRHKIINNSRASFVEYVNFPIQISDPRHKRLPYDFNNIKIGLEKTLSDNDYEAALSIIENSNYELQNTSEKMLEFDTGNGIVDALLSDKQSKANKSNTRIVFSGSVPPDSIAPTDLCVLFGNTLDNAIEACEKFEDETEKTIFVSCKCNSGFAFISITNPVADDVVIRGNSIDSTKADKASHGYGLYSLNKIVKKLDGSLNLSCEDKTFKVEIDLSLEQTAIYA